MIDCILHCGLISLLQPPRGVQFFRPGLWRGTYTQHGTVFPQSMHLQLHDGVIEGQGEDNVGPFYVLGTYDEPGGLAAWLKKYVGRHFVVYEGRREGDHLVGAWRIESRSITLSDCFEFTPPPAS